MSSARAAERPRQGLATGSARRPAGSAPPILVVGLGNPLLGDDAVGWHVVEEVERRLGSAAIDARAVELDRLAVGGLALMERLVGYERVVLVDALAAGTGPPGAVSVGRLEELGTREASHLDNAHDATLPVALAAGRALGADLPDDILVVGIETGRVDLFADGLTDDVAAVVGPAADAVVSLIRGSARP